MGAMTAGFGISLRGVSVNGKRTVTAICSPSTSYATGGDTLPPVVLQELKRVDAVFQTCLPGVNQSGLSYELAGTPEAPLLKAFDVAPAGTEVAAATNLSTRGAAGLLFEGYSV